IGDDFWIPQSAIIPVCRETLWQNISMALQADAYPLLKSSDESLNAITGTLSFTVEGRGLTALQDAELLVVPKTPALSVGATSAIGTVTPFQVKTVSVPYQVAENTPNGTPLDFVCTITFNDGKTLDYPFRLLWKGGDAISGDVIFADNFTTLDRWATTGTWGLTTNSFTSGPAAITDSPEGAYNNYVNMKIDTRDAIDLRGIQTAYLTFKARWNIERDDDYLQVTVIKNNVEYPVCGNYSRVNDSGRMVYDGNQNNWINEQINLADFLGQQIKLRFRLKSDGSGTADGFFLDDLAVTVVAQDDNEPPVLEWIEPAHNTIVEIDQEIKLRFSENIMMLHEEEIALKRVTDQAVVESEIQVSGHELMIKPLLLEYSTHYFLEISATAIADLNGNYFPAMNSNNWAFSTIARPDETPPVINSLMPLPGTTNVSEDAIFTAEFSEPILIHAELIKLINEQEQEVPADVSVVDQTTLTLSPHQNLDPGNTYSIIFPPGSVEDVNHNMF
ncbi:MAG TPA: Ig-like domain-containing protein, partial [Cyclobacteriaceae bacterium]|nr:Ig-like domain-containing protein [Cyclobacteriaceae bacterium]